MQAKRLMRRRGSGHRSVLTMVSLLALRGQIPIIPAPREDRGGISWRPVLFGLGAAVGFAVALGRARTVEAPGVSPLSATPSTNGTATTTATTATVATSGNAAPSRVESAIGRSIHLPSPLKDTIEAELSTDGPLLFSPPDAIDPIGTEGSEGPEEAATAEPVEGAAQDTDALASTDDPADAAQGAA